MYLTEKFGIVPVIESADYGGAGKTSDSFKMSHANWATVVFTFGAITGNSTLIMYSGSAAATLGTAETFTYRLSEGDFGAASADLWGAASTSASLSLVAATYDHRMVAVEIDPAALTDGQPWITFVISSTANPMNVAAIGHLVPRYAVPGTNLA